MRIPNWNKGWCLGVCMRQWWSRNKAFTKWQPVPASRVSCARHLFLRAQVERLQPGEGGKGVIFRKATAVNISNWECIMNAWLRCSFIVLPTSVLGYIKRQLRIEKAKTGGCGGVRKLATNKNVPGLSLSLPLESGSGQYLQHRHFAPWYWDVFDRIGVYKDVMLPRAHEELFQAEASSFNVSLTQQFSYPDGLMEYVLFRALPQFHL